MRSSHLVELDGERYTAEPLKSSHRITSLHPPGLSHVAVSLWTLPIRSNETTKEFEARCIAWLRDLYGLHRP